MARALLLTKAARGRLGPVAFIVMLCPDDLEPCRRPDCGRGYCQRTAGIPLADCRECGTVVEYRVSIAVCADCVVVHSPTVEEES